jgi:7-keto-8-aminopelargonate synthetase-like enzyme
MGTFSKALGSFGGFIAGSKVLIEYLKNTARTFFYSTSLPPGVLGASIKAIEIVDKEPERLKNLWGNVTRFRKGIEKVGVTPFDYAQGRHASPMNSETPIIPILTGENERTLKLAGELFANGIFVPAVRPPTVSKGKCRLRFTVMATHTKEQIEQCLEVLEKLVT